MRTVTFALEGREYHLLLNGAALFNIYDYFGPDVHITDLIQEPGREGFGNLCWLFGELGQQGELYRRYQGYDPQPIPDAGELEVTLRPLDAIRAKRALMEAIAAGFLREEGEAPKEIDKGLLELEKKTGPG